MNDHELDSKIKDYFLGQKLADEKVQRILEQGKVQKTRSWWQHWVPVAAAAAILMVLSFQLTRNYEQDEFGSEVAGKIAIRHNTYTNVDVEAADYSTVQAGLKDLAFSVTPLVKNKLLSAYQVIGARYCQLEGQQAAHMQVRHRTTGAICTLYVASLKGPLASLQETDDTFELEANTVRMWQDTGRLYALVD